MKSEKPPQLGDPHKEITGLIETLHMSGRRLEDLTAGEVDAVTDRGGRTFLLRRAQDKLRQSEAAKQAAILDSLPAHIALIDMQGRIISVNAAWERFPCPDIPHGAAHRAGLNYLTICDNAQSEYATEARKLAEGIRSVLAGGVDSFSLEYSCRSPTDRFWFQLTVTPLGSDPPTGAVIMHLDITERKHGEEETRRFTSAMDAISDGILLVDRASMRFVHVNDAACRYQNQTREDLLAQDPWATIPMSRESLERAFDAIIASGRPAEPVEMPRTRKDGSQAWIEIRRHARFAGERWMVVTLVRDITERRLAEDAILREKNFNEAMLASLPGLFYVIDDQGQFIRWNSNFETVSGNSPAELSRLGAMHFFDAADQAIVASSIAQVFATGDAAVEADFLAKDLTRIPYYFTGKRVELEHQPRLIGMGIDISERKRAGQALRESERRFSDMLGNVQLVSLMLDCEARITYCNDYFLRLTGWRDEEVVGQSWFELFIPPGIPYLRDSFYPALLRNAPKTMHHENEIVTRAGERRLIRWNNSVLRSATGEVTGTASIGEDITEQKQAEIKIKRLNRVYAILSGINTLIVRVRDREELFTEACRIAVEHGHFKMAWIGIVDTVAMKILPMAFAGEGDPEFLRVIKDISLREGAPGGNTMTARGIREKKAIVSNEIRNDSRVMFAKQRTERGISSMAILPLLVAGEAVGVFALYAGEPGFFDAEEMKLLEELAGDIAFAVENIGRQQKHARLTRTRAVSSEISNAIIRIRDRDELFRETCRIAVDAGAFRMAWIGVIDPQTRDGKVIAWYGGEAGYVDRIKITAREGTPDSERPACRALRRMQPVVCNDIATDLERGPLRDEILRRGHKSLACFPLVVMGLPKGVISLFSGDSNVFDEEEIGLLQELVGNIALAVDHIEKQGQLDYLAYYDELTGLANRKLFLERVAQYMRAATKSGHKLALYLVDLERFKNINDSLGQAAGDTLLRQVGEWLTRNGGDANLFARIGADLFAAVLPEVRRDGDLRQLIEKIVTAFVEHPFRLNDSVFRIGAKTGIAIFPEDARDADSLFKNAEAALKKAKSTGERYLFYTQTMTDRVAGKLSLENQLRQALDREEFVLHYQPKVNLSSGKVTGVEALIRWNDPRTGLVPPGHFIPILEETGLVYEVGRWALRKAVADYLRWRAAGLQAVRVAVNVSPLQLRNRGFVDEIMQVVGIDAHAAAGLELEITESLIMEDVKHNIASLQAIRAMGVTIAIDDFGTGFSSLSYLSRLPVDKLKIDRSFVIDMTASSEGLALVSTIVSLAHALKLKVVAEGVETDEQSRLLHLLNCDEMQGYLFSKPVPGDIFESKYLTPPVTT